MKKPYDFLVIGAGPAGIIAIGQLLQRGITNIAWVDPLFTVGDFSKQWANVSSNTTVTLFTKTYHACDQFKQWLSRTLFAIDQCDPEKTCLLKQAAEPLQYITNKLKDKLDCEQATVNQLTLQQGCWQASLSNQQVVTAQHVILAIGAEARSLHYSKPEQIPLTTALDINKLKTAIKPNDNVAVFGSSHSAIIMIRDLLSLGCNVINFYRQPLRYAVQQEGWTLFDNTGLKGNTAIWARENLQGNLPKNLTRLLSTEHTVQAELLNCNKVIYGIGFKRRHIEIEGLSNDFNYNPHNGIIAPGLFGLGIAFPEQTIDPYHNTEFSVGLWKFTRYLQKILPLWCEYGLPNTRGK